MDEIEITSYDPAWPTMFEGERRRLHSLLPASLLMRVEHIGSTAVPGLAAKPVIDLMVLVSSLETARAVAVAPLEAGGYAWWADNPDPERLFFVRGLPPSAPHRTHHLHLTESPIILRRHLAFRDALRANALEREHYAALKRALAGLHGNNREAYTRAKAAHIEAMLVRAGLSPSAGRGPSS